MFACGGAQESCSAEDIFKLKLKEYLEIFQKNQKSGVGRKGRTSESMGMCEDPQMGRAWRAQGIGKKAPELAGLKGVRQRGPVRQEGWSPA